jgi:hypothetical protein
MKRMDGTRSGRFLGGMKIYSLDWFLRYHFDYVEAADLLARQGIDVVIAQNRYLPMADTAVQSEVAPEEQARFELYDDRRFVEALQAAGLRYFAAANVFFDPLTLAQFPDARAVDAAGQRATAVDWYIAICPTHRGYFEAKRRQIQHAVERLHPDGVFLGFTRFPGFWELWLPDTSRRDWPEYCFCPRCIGLFAAAKGVAIPKSAAERAGEWIRAHVNAEYVDWKTDVVRGAVERIRATVTAMYPDVEMMLNTVPFGPAAFGGAGREVFAQDWSKLREVVDIFELMAYHQILRRDVSWIGQIARALKAEVHRPVLVTVQAKPLYVDGMHAGRGRNEELPFEEFVQALEVVRASGVDGVVVFTWSDFLRQSFVQKDFRYVDALRRITRG